VLIFAIATILSCSFPALMPIAVFLKAFWGKVLPYNYLTIQKKVINIFP
jgi:hypothetical protein